MFATGRIDVDFYCFGTTEDDGDKFIIVAIGAAKNEATTRKNPAGSLSSPDVVWLKVLSVLNIRHLVMSVELSELFAESLTLGAT